LRTLPTLMPDTPPSDRFPRPFGKYLLLAEIGAGGMGVVYQAVHTTSGRSCALKLIRPESLASAESADLQASAEQRFATEIEAASALEHEGIVRVLHSGVHEGRRFLAMELVEGGTLADRLASGPLPPREAAALLARLARAVQFAHERGILHRDLKPGNVLLDEAGAPRLTDFGIARLLNRESDLTRTLAYLGTPAYMAPELATGSARDATTAADTYSLGAILYECLSGRPPFTAETVAALLHKVATETPAPLLESAPAFQHLWDFTRRRDSGVRRPVAAFSPGDLSPGAAGQVPPPKSADQSAHSKGFWSRLRSGAKSNTFPRDLAVLTHRALAREPGHRFASAGELADELERFLHGEPIRSRPVPLAERLWLWCRRHPRAAFATAAALVASLAALITILVLWQQAARTSAELQRERGQLRQTVVQDTLRLADGDLAAGKKPAAFQRVAETALRLKGAQGLTEWLEERLAKDTIPVEVQSLGFPGEVEAHFDRARHRIVSAGLGGYWLHDQTTGKLLLHLPTLTPLQKTAQDQGLEIWESPDGSRVLGHEHSGMFALWNIENLEQPSLVWTNPPGSPVAVAPDRQFFVTGDTNGNVTLGCLGIVTNSLNDLATGATLARDFLRQLPALPVAAARFGLSSGASVIAAGLPDGRLFTLRPGSNAWAHIGTWHTNLSVLVVSPDGQHLLASTDWECAGWSLGARPSHFTFTNSANIWGLSISPHAPLFAVASQDGLLTLRSLANGLPEGEALRFSGTPAFVEFTPNGREVLLGSDSGEAVLVQVSPRQVLAATRQVHMALSVDYDEENHLLLTGSDDGLVRFWRLAPPDSRIQVSTNLPRISTVSVLPAGLPASVQSSPSLTRLASDSQQTLLALSRVSDSVQIVPLGQLPTNTSRAFAPLPEPALFLADAEGRLSRQLVPIAGPPDELARMKPPITRLIVSEKGDALLAVLTNKLLTLAIAGRTAQVRLEVPLLGANNLTFSPVGDFAAASVQEGTVTVVAPRQGRKLWSSRDHIGPLYGLAFSPDGKRLATASLDGSVRVYDSISGGPLIPPFKKLTMPSGLCWDGTGERLFVGGLDAGVMLDARTGTELGRFAPMPGYNRVALSPNGQRVAFASSKGEVSVWSTAGRNQLQTWDMSQSWDNAAKIEWSADSSELLTLNTDGLVRFIRMPPPLPSDVLPDLLEWITGQTLNADGASVDLSASARAERLARLRAAAARGDLAPAYARHLPLP
jgi:serine/threonine protein kinase/WD40 repeat protein